MGSADIAAVDEGVSAAAVAAVEESAGQIVRAVKARYSDEEWPDIARPLRDVVREGERDALVAYILSTGYAKNPDELFAWLLVDTETSPCVLTSRIKQAIGSLQTFVQRAQLGLEPKVTLDADQTNEWKWTKNYRVWEANRKVFLYPENWLEPALRDDKTSFFKEFESQIRRQEIDDETAEEAFIHYLDRVADVADLEVVALHTQDDTVHVVGRTRASPHQYYYRTGTRISAGEGARVWTPWERIDLDIDSEHLFLIDSDRSLALVWGLVEVKPNEEQPDNTKPPDTEETQQGGTEPPRTHLEIGVAISERKQGRWTAPRTSRSRLSTASIYKNHTKLGGATVPSRFELCPEEITFMMGEFKVHCMMNLNRIIKQCDDSPHIGWGVSSFLLLGRFAVDPCRLNIEAVPVERDGFWIATGHDTKLTDSMVANKQKSIDELTADNTTYHAAIDALSQPAVKNVSKKNISDLEEQIAANEEEIKKLEKEQDEIDGMAPVILWWTNPVQRFTCEPGPGDQWYFRGQVAVLRVAGPIDVKDHGKTTRLLDYGKAGGTTIVRPLRVGTEGGEPGYPNTDVGPFALHHEGSTFLVERSVAAEVEKGYQVTLLSHPGACKQLTALRQRGLDGLLNDRDLQLSLLDLPEPQWTQGVTKPEGDVMSFGPTNASSIYNWEVFFHAPLFIAVRLMAARRFDEARKWFERIFDPTQAKPRGEDAKKLWAKGSSLYWKPRPLFENKNLSEMNEALAAFDGGDESTLKVEIKAQIEAWRRDPFKPYVIARLRTIAFQKAVVMKYVQNLIAWGDELFRRDTIESITEATGLYIFARDVLGPRPPKVTPATAPDTMTAGDLVDGVFESALVESESLVDARSCGDCTGEPPPMLLTGYFCVPGNEKLDELWDTIADRLFKIRHCMNIDGVERELALFEPPIDPALLVQAAAAGVDLNSVLNDLSGGRLPYRYQVLHGRAMELTGAVVQLGQSLLSTLEKRDGEELSLLRSGQEVEVLKAQRLARVLETREAGQALAAAQASMRVIEQRRDHYAGLIASGPNEDESASLKRAQDAMIITAVAGGTSLLASAMMPIPDAKAGSAGIFPIATASLGGGTKIAMGARFAADALNIASSILQSESRRLETMASRARRLEDWVFQMQTAQAELAHAARQVAAAEIRQAVAQASLAAHDLQVDNAKAVDEYMRSKLTGADLFEWMADRLTDVYYEAYKLAYDMAKRAERAMRSELAIPDDAAHLIGFGYWDSAKKGLGAGEQLQQSLRALDVAYHEQNRRELEITKHVSLLSLRPEELIKLRETGACDVELEERHFDYDYPGHYLRRIRTVSMTIPAVSGPYSGVNARLTMQKNEMRKTSALKGLAYPKQANDSRFASDLVPIEGVVTSSGQNDAGMFEAVLRDDRYLPFEGAGAISKWHIEMPPETNGFDISAIADLVLHVRYTARDGGKPLRTAAETAVTKATREDLQCLVSARTMFPEAWEAFMNPEGDDPPTLTLTLTQAMFQYVFGNNAVEATEVRILAKWSLPEVYFEGDNKLKLDVTPPGDEPETENDLLLAENQAYGQLATVLFHIEDGSSIPALGTWTIVATNVGQLPDTPPGVLQTDGRLNETLLDICLLITYQQDVGST